MVNDSISMTKVCIISKYKQIHHKQIQLSCFVHHHFPFLNSSLSSTKITPRRFLPVPSPPSPQYRSFQLNSTIILLPVESNFSNIGGFCSNFSLKPSFITFYFTSCQSALKGSPVLSLPLSKASLGVGASATYFYLGVPQNFLDWKQCSLVGYSKLPSLKTEGQKFLKTPYSV